MSDKYISNKIYTLLAYASLSPYWKKYFMDIDCAIQENFWGNLSTMKQAERKCDVYIKQQKEMGYCYKSGTEAPASFYQSLTWVFNRIHALLDQGVLSSSDILWPSRVFEKKHADGSVEYFFSVIGEDPPNHTIEVNLVSPHVFVTMLAQGYFPVGGAIREHTNQTLAEHDLAHYGGFISAPHYMRAMRKAFQRVYKKMQDNPNIYAALHNFNSIYSLRLYYMMEIFTIIPETRKKKLQMLLALDINKPVKLDEIISFLEKQAKHPANLYRYLHRIYHHFDQLVNPVGGESRDILNRIRKFNRASRLGAYYGKSNVDSKFDGSSIYSLYLNGCAALENKRSTHADFSTSLREIHAPFLGALIGTSQLTIDDWVLQGAEEIPDQNSKLYQYLCKSGIWNESHLIYLAYGCYDYSRILSKKTATSTYEK